MAQNTTIQTAESLQPTPTPVVVAEQAAMDMGANVKCVVVPKAETPKHECGYDIVAQAPAGKGVLAYLVGPGANVILKGVDADKATFVEEGENLRITTADGGEILLLDFVTSAKQESCTSLTTDSGKIVASKLLAGLEEPAQIEPAAGPTTVVRPVAAPVVSGHGGFTAPTIDGDGFGFGDKVLSTVIGPYAIPFGRDSIEYKEYPTAPGPNAPILPPPGNNPPDARNDVATTKCEHPVTITVLANDSDPDSDPLTVVGIVAGPVHGTVVINANGTITYTPTGHFTGEDFFQYQISDGNGGFDTAQVKVVVYNNAPDAVADVRTTAFNTPITVAVLGNDSDPDGDTFTITGTTNPAHGSIVVNANGTITYTPTTGFTGVDTFTYTITDDCGASDTTTVTITVGTPPPANDTDAVNDTATTHCGNAVTISVLANDSDAQGDTFSITGTTNPAHGTIVVNANGTITYTPAIHFLGTDTFTYTITDAKGATDTATVTVNVVNTPPDAVNDNVSTAFNTPITINVLANDSDPDGDPIAVDGVVSGPAHGTVVLNADGTFTYTPANGFTGTDSFVYSIDDPCGDHDTAVVTITVGQPPFNDVDARNDTATTHCGNAVTVAVLGNDVDAQGDSFSITGTTNPAHGTIVVNAGGTITYTPAIGFLGTDTFTYTITDAKGATDTATVTVNVVNQGPDAVNDTATTKCGVPVTINVLANDSDPDGDPIAVDGVVSGPAHGTVVLNADGTFTYTPTDHFVGTDSFTYSIDDPCGAHDTATVYINVTNNAPDAVNDSKTTPCGTPVTINVLANDSDPDGDAISVTRIVTGPAHGTAVLNANGTITYTPAHGFSGNDTFTYEITDDCGAKDIATVTITVTNNPPDANNDVASTHCGDAVVINVLANDVDPDGHPLTVNSIVSGPAHGTVVINANGTITYTPTGHFTGEDFFQYKISDGCGGYDVAQVKVVVTNNAPDAVNDSKTTACGTPVTINVLANDSDIDHDAISVTRIVTGPAHGTAVLHADGTITYTPAHGFVGNDTFTYEITDDCGAKDIATVTVTTTNNPPDANNDVASTHCGDPVTINVLANDVDPDGHPLTVNSIVSGPAHGTVVINANGTITYTPTGHFTGEDFFQYKISDGCGGYDVAQVKVVVTNNPPEAVKDYGSVTRFGSTTINVLANDSDVDGDAIHVTSITQAAHGHVVLNANGTVTYTHTDSSFSGTDVFTYTITDDCGLTSTAQVCITVPLAPPPPPPPPVCPLVIDLDGNGIHAIAGAESHASFDLFNDGTPEHTAWFSSTDGILVHDLNGDGIINNMSEMFGTTDTSSNGYEVLAAREDTNGDGIINADDAGFSALRLWVDANGDGISQADELHSLADYNIVSIDTHGVESHQDLTDDSFISHVGTVTLGDGSTLGSADIWFETANQTADTTTSQGGTTDTGATSTISLDQVLGQTNGDDVAAMPVAHTTDSSDTTYVAAPVENLHMDDLTQTAVLHG